MNLTFPCEEGNHLACQDSSGWCRCPCHQPPTSTQCEGCLTGSDVGVPYGGIAYAHPNCPIHGLSS
jgi:hypothetical protein